MNSFVGLVGTMLLFLLLGRRASIHPFWVKVLIITAAVMQVGFVVVDLYMMETPAP